jgi:hypothetical protein
MRPSRGLGFAFQRTLRRNYDALAKYMDSLHRKQRLRFRIHDRTAASISGLVLRPSTRAPMTIARRILKSRTVFGPPAKLTGFSRDGLTCFHQQLRSSNPGGSYLLDLDCGGDRCPAYVRPQPLPGPTADIPCRGQGSPTQCVHFSPQVRWRQRLRAVVPSGGAPRHS